VPVVDVNRILDGFIPELVVCRTRFPASRRLPPSDRVTLIVMVADHHRFERAAYGRTRRPK